jgi:hypothetical protein
MTDFHLASGTATITVAQWSKTVVTGLTDLLFEPVICTTPFGENANVNTFLETLVFYEAGQWKFRINRSIAGHDGGDAAPAQTFFWKVIAMKTVPEIGPTVVPVSD